MDRAQWLEYLDTDLGTRSQEHSKLWGYGFALLVAGASLSVFVARTFDASDPTAVRLGGTLMAIGFSCAMYILVVDRVVGQLIRSHPPLRLSGGPSSEGPRVLPLAYRLFNPRGMALVVIGVVLALLPREPLPWGPTWLQGADQWAASILTFLFVLGGLGVSILDGQSTSKPVHRLLRGLSNAVVMVAWPGVIIVMLGTFVETIHRAEAGVAMLGIACIPALFLSAIHLLRWVSFDHSVERMERLRLHARRANLDAGSIEEEYFRIEDARARGPVAAEPRQSGT